MNQDRPRNAQSVAAGSSFVSVESIWRDIRFAVRSLLKAPGFAVVAILVLAVAAYDSGGAGLNLTGNDQPEEVQGVHVTADYFSVLGAPVIAGRTFTAAEDSPHGGNVVVLGYGLWKRRFGGDRGIVGKNIQLN